MLVGAAVLAASEPALAVPSFARQTGFECTVCHLSWPELTSVGRQFKLGGYTLMRETKGERPLLPTSNDGPPPLLPLAAMVQGSLTNTRGTSGADASNFPRNDDLVLQQLSVFYAGRIVEHFGAFVQWTYDGIAHHSAVDNVDVRVAGHFEGGGVDLGYGVTVNNNPTASDLYNTTPTWGFPYASSSVAVAPNASTLIDGGLAQQVAGIGAYTMLNQSLYAEVAGYRTADVRCGRSEQSDGYAAYVQRQSDLLLRSEVRRDAPILPDDRHGRRCALRHGRTRDRKRERQPEEQWARRGTRLVAASRLASGGPVHRLSGIQRRPHQL
jgi:hypothetical protein